MLPASIARSPTSTGPTDRQVHDDSIDASASSSSTVIALSPKAPARARAARDADGNAAHIEDREGPAAFR